MTTPRALEPPAPRIDRVPPAAVVAVAVADLRRLPDHKSELVSQGLFGESYRVLELASDARWLHVRGDDDGYAGWVRSWSLARGSRAAVIAWRARARWRVDVPWLDAGAGLGALPFGALVDRPGAGVRRSAARGSAGIGSRSLGRALLRTARRFAGVPYHWGGRTFAGVDCSGLVQLAARAQGLSLPRDAREQCRAVGGVSRLRPIEAALSPDRPGGVRPGDLWFFGPNRREVTHVAISAGGLDLVHAYGRVGAGSLDPLSGAFEPELFRFVLGWQRLTA